MRLTVSHLRQLIREALAPEETLKLDATDTYLTVTVTHSKTFNLPNGSTYVVPDYEKSELRCQIKREDGELVIVNAYVPESQQRRGVAKEMIAAARQFAKENNLEVYTSGVYSDKGKALAQSFADKGDASMTNKGRHRLG